MADVTSILDAHAAQRARLLAAVERQLTAMWEGLGSWDKADVADFVASVVPLVNGAQSLTGSHLDAYVSEVLSELLGRSVQPVGVPELTGLRGVPEATVYQRPFVEMWTALGKGVPFTQAKAQGLDRLLRLAEDDEGLAFRRATMVVMDSHSEVKGYRRILRPEKDTCGLCIAAATQVYHRSTLMPIHTHCHCTVMPIVGRQDPGKHINGQDLDQLYRQASEGGRDAKALSAAKFTVHEHGELGPMLIPKGQEFTGPSIVAA